MRAQLYIWDGLRKDMKKDLAYIRELYFEKIEPVFSDAEVEAEAYTQRLWDNAMSAPCYGEDCDPDFSGIAEACQEAGIERYEILSLMRYRNLGMWLSCMCQVWEQQLIRFIKHEVENDGLIEFTKEVDFNEAKECFKFHNYNIESMKCWEQIKELRLLVNVIKHAEGNSADRLRKIRPDYFEWDKRLGYHDDKLKFHKTTLLEQTLNITNKDFDMYYNALVSFWDEIPERMFSEELEQ
ncbi:MAG: hypothetical protein A2Y23_08770 [Clostridiales bacterium GWB2_37_7]|nr:MAG: hypothetical protein A2Y23_08770 [Clostridiales bacterium GWB2_37_7]